MTIEEAKRLYEKYRREVLQNQSHENEDAWIEIAEFLAEKTEDPWYTRDLGGYYYRERKFDLALKYYEKTYELNDPGIAGCLGYIWYYGRTGTVDYEKAFRYFSEAASMGDCDGKRKLADMYKNGYFVKQDLRKYREIIEDLYEEHKNDADAYWDLPDICTRLAKIRADEGKIEDAVRLFRIARKDLAVRLRHTGFFGDVNVMEWLINDLYALIEPDYSDLDIFDLFYVMKEPKTASFRCRGKVFQITSSLENGEYAVEYDGKFYRSMNEFFRKAMILGKPIYVRYPEIYNTEVMHERND